VTTQLRLVDTAQLESAPAAARAPRRARAVKATTARKGAPKVARTGTRTGTSRSARAVRWPGELHLDARTRRVGRAGVAAAREALERVAAEQERARAEREGRSQRAS
jgi:hypothetical protein